MDEGNFILKRRMQRRLVEVTLEERDRAAMLSKEYRRTHGLSQKQLANIIGCHNTNISMLEFPSYSKTPAWIVKRVIELCMSEVM